MTRIEGLALFYLVACSAPQSAPARAPAPAPTPRGPMTPQGLPLGGDDCELDGSGEPCRAGLSCFPREAGKGQGVCALAATIEELVSRTSYDGALVGVRRARFGGSTICTEMECGESNPCCNSCAARYTITDAAKKYEIRAARESGELYEVRGDECEIRRVSSGLPAGWQVIVGRVQRTEEGLSLQLKYLVPEEAGP